MVVPRKWAWLFPGSGRGINVLCGHYVMILSISSIVMKGFDKMKY